MVKMTAYGRGNLINNIKAEVFKPLLFFGKADIIVIFCC